MPFPAGVVELDVLLSFVCTLSSLISLKSFIRYLNCVWKESFPLSDSDLQQVKRIVSGMYVN